MTASIIIPARFKSSRFPGKPLTKLQLKSGESKPLIQLSWEAAKRVDGIRNIYIATDDFEIKRTAESFGADVIMTSSKCENGTARCAEAIKVANINDDIIINFQGDAPLTPKCFVETLISFTTFSKAFGRLFARAINASASVVITLVAELLIVLLIFTITLHNFFDNYSHVLD